MRRRPPRAPERSQVPKKPRLSSPVSDASRQAIKDLLSEQAAPIPVWQRSDRQPTAKPAPQAPPVIREAVPTDNKPAPAQVAEFHAAATEAEIYPLSTVTRALAPLFAAVVTSSDVSAPTEPPPSSPPKRLQPQLQANSLCAFTAFVNNLENGKIPTSLPTYYSGALLVSIAKSPSEPHCLRSIAMGVLY